MQHDILLESIAETVHQDEDSNDSTDEMAEADEVDMHSPASSIDKNVETNSIAKRSMENRDDEYVDDNSDYDDSTGINKSRRVSKPCGYSKDFPETAHTQTDTTEGQWLKPHYYDELEMIKQMSDVIFYKESCLSEDVLKKRRKTQICMFL